MFIITLNTFVDTFYNCRNKGGHAVYFANSKQKMCKKNPQSTSCIVSCAILWLCSNCQLFCNILAHIFCFVYWKGMKLAKCFVFSSNIYFQRMLAYVYCNNNGHHIIIVFHNIFMLFCCFQLKLNSLRHLCFQSLFRRPKSGQFFLTV